MTAQMKKKAVQKLAEEAVPNASLQLVHVTTPTPTPRICAPMRCTGSLSQRAQLATPGIVATVIADAGSLNKVVRSGPEPLSIDAAVVQGFATPQRS